MPWERRGLGEVRSATAGTGHGRRKLYELLYELLSLISPFGSTEPGTFLSPLMPRTSPYLPAAQYIAAESLFSFLFLREER